jgi:hypothetical protein
MALMMPGTSGDENGSVKITIKWDDKFTDKSMAYTENTSAKTCRTLEHWVSHLTEAASDRVTIRCD